MNITQTLVLYHIRPVNTDVHMKYEDMKLIISIIICTHSEQDQNINTNMHIIYKIRGYDLRSYDYNINNACMDNRLPIIDARDAA